MLHLLPASESVVCYFAVHLANSNLKHHTIKAYLWAPRFLCIAEGFIDLFESPLNRVQCILKRNEAEKSGVNKERLPVGPDTLSQIKAVWDQESSDPDKIMLWAACCLGSFGFPWAGEFTVPARLTQKPWEKLYRWQALIKANSVVTASELELQQLQHREE